MSVKNLEHKSILDFILSVLTRNDDKNEIKEMRRYDTIQFEDVNKEIKRKKKEVHKEVKV
jgi:hypothetical protein